MSVLDNLLFSSVKKLSPLFEINDLRSIIWSYLATLHFDLQRNNEQDFLEFPETAVKFFGDDNLLVVYVDDSRLSAIIKVFASKTDPFAEEKQDRFHHSLTFKKIQNEWPVFDIYGDKVLAHFMKSGLVASLTWPESTRVGGIELKAIDDLPVCNNRFVRMDDQFLYMLDENGHLLIYDQETKLKVQEKWILRPYKNTGFHICVESNQFLLRTNEEIAVWRYEWVSKKCTLRYQYAIEAKDVISLCVDYPSQRIVFVTQSKPDTLYFHDLKTGFLCDTCCIEKAEFSCIAYSSQSSQLIAIDKKFKQRREYRVRRSVF